jgi:hypothetical protein
VSAAVPASKLDSVRDPAPLTSISASVAPLFTKVIAAMDEAALRLRARIENMTIFFM